MPERTARRSYFATLKPAVELVWRASPYFFLALVSLTFASALLPLAGVYLNALLLGRLAAAVHAATPPGLRPLLGLVALIGATTALGQLVARVTDTVQRLYEKRTAHFVQGLVVEKAAALDLAFYEDPELLNKMQKASSEAAHRPLVIVQQLMQAVSALTTIVSLGAVMLVWKIWLLPLILLSPLMLLWISARVAAENVEMAARRTEIERKAQYLKQVLTDERAAKELRIFGLQSFLLSRLRTVWMDIYRQEGMLAKRKFWTRGVGGALLSLDRVVFVGYATSQLLARAITFTQFSLYTQAIFSLQGGLRALTTALGQLHESHLFIAHLFEFLALEPRVEAPRSMPSGWDPTTTPPVIEFRGVTFCYPNTAKLVLEDINFRLAPGEVVALAGENGAGKSTLVKLLVGLYEPTAGQILLNGVDIRILPRALLRRHFSVLLQDFRVYDFTLYDNIAFGAIEAWDESSRISAAADRAGLKKIVDALPRKFATPLGRHFKGGHELSGGQKQLVALARAMLRNAAVVVMDEPTAALDIHNERRVFDQVLGSRRVGRQSVLLISHRMTAVRRADRILVIERGCVIEQGSHAELLAAHGSYARMFQTQIEMYGDLASDIAPVMSGSARFAP